MTSSTTVRNCLVAAAVWAIVWAAPSRAAEPLHMIITVEAGKTDRVDTPVSLEIAKALTLPANVQLQQLPIVKGGKAIAVAVPCQLDAGPPMRLSWILSGKTPAGATRTFILSAGKGTAAGGVTVTKDAKVLDIAIGKAKVLRYNHAVVLPPAGTDPKYKRSGFIHPLWSPDGQVLTQIHPKDHYHHVGLWHPWTNSKFEGKKLDFWNLRAGQGTVRFAKFLATAQGPVFGEFSALQEHVALKASGGPKVALNDTFNVRAWKLSAAPDGFLLDFVSTQRCASDSPLELAKYRYGGFGFRGNAAWGYDNSDYLTSEGKKRKDGHATTARWCIIHGTTKKGPAGVLFMSHPANHAHPEPMRIWDNRPEIFFNFCPIQRAPLTLKPGNDYIFRYRAYTFKGKLTADEAERLWQDFANPPQAKAAPLTFRTSTPDTPVIHYHTSSAAAQDAKTGVPVTTNPFFILNNGTGRGKLPPAEQAKLLKDNGCDGLSYSGTKDVDKMLTALESAGLKMHMNYLPANVGAKGPGYTPDLAAAIKTMAGHGTVVWLYVRGAKRGDKAAEARAVKVIREIADLAAAAKLRVALYPHAGFYIERFDHALEIAEKVARKNVGVTFNLCHWLQVQPKDDITAALTQAMAAKRLFVVTINGADAGGKGWKKLIQTLDKGTFDNLSLVKTLRRLGYSGPVGLQCYGVGGDLRENLKRSAAAWRKMSDAANAGGEGSQVIDASEEKSVSRGVRSRKRPRCAGGEGIVSCV